MSEETKPTGKSLAELLNIASSATTFENMKKLCALDEYECPKGSGIKYKRKMLKPKDIVQLNKLQNSLEDENPQKRMDNIKAQAFICLDGMTEEKWEETDASLMEIIVGACLLISKGFREV